MSLEVQVGERRMMDEGTALVAHEDDGTAHPHRRRVVCAKAMAGVGASPRSRGDLGAWAAVGLANAIVGFAVAMGWPKTADHSGKFLVEGGKGSGASLDFGWPGRDRS